MFRLAFLIFLVGLGLATWMLPANLAIGAVESDEQQLAEASPTQLVAGTADVELRFIQEDGPESGHVRVELTPETRPLTVWEARSAAQQGFLEALNEKGLGDRLSRITVVVRLMPKAHPDPGAAEQVFRFLHKGGQDWTIQAGE